MRPGSPDNILIPSIPQSVFSLKLHFNRPAIWWMRQCALLTAEAGAALINGNGIPSVWVTAEVDPARNRTIELTLWTHERSLAGSRNKTTGYPGNHANHMLKLENGGCPIPGPVSLVILVRPPWDWHPQVPHGEPEEGQPGIWGATHVLPGEPADLDSHHPWVTSKSSMWGHIDVIECLHASL